MATSPKTLSTDQLQHQSRRQAELLALPPAYQRMAELKAIIDQPDLVAAFPQNTPIDEISYVSPDLSGEGWRMGGQRQDRRQGTARGHSRRPPVRRGHWQGRMR